MTPDRESDVERICHQALALDAAAREAFVAEACAGDEGLRREVESLLRQQSKADGFLAEPALMAAAPYLAVESGQSLVGGQLGAYQIHSLLGAGGMGEVYKARDTKLGRDVAVKILPRLFSSDPDRLARFEREARVLASLNHPHIGAIYGVEDAEGTRALILELVDGPTLADRLASGPLPMRDALTIAVQIAEALEAAHGASLVHRDLKPANIKVTPAGVVKVLDFGLAKAATGDGSHPDLSRDGVLLGTAGYMSPEQARGEAVDRRTDIWAFGCVLYEMLTGQSGFGGATTVEVLSNVLKADLDWTALPASTPPAIQSLLRRCLQKDRNQRLRDITDARFQIEDVLSGASGTPAESGGADPQLQRVRLPWSIAAVASLVALIAVGALTWIVRVALRGRTTPPSISRTSIASSGGAAVTPTDGRSLAITPDGTRVVYIGNYGRQVFVRRLDQLDPTAIVTSVAPLSWVFISPDGQWVGFVVGLGLQKVALTGGPSVPIATVTPDSVGATWAPDDTIIMADGDPTTGLRRVSAGGGTVTVLTRPVRARGELDHLWPEMLPGGRAVLFTMTATTGGLDAAQVAVLDLATGTPRVLVRGGSHAHYVPSGLGSPNRAEREAGHLVYTAGGTLRAVPFDLARLETRGTPVTVLPRLVTTLQGAGDFDVAADGTLAYVDAPGATLSAGRTLVWVDRQGREDPLGAPPRPYFHPRLSPDGTRVAVAIADQGNDIWVWDLARKTLNQLTSDPAAEFNPVWTKDGRRVLFFLPARQRGGGAGERSADAAGLFWQSADGTGAAEAIGNGIPSGVTPDGKQVLFSLKGLVLMVMTLDGTRRVERLLSTESTERNAVVSPDGRWLAYESNSSGRFEIYVRPFPNVSAGQWLISTAGGTRPLWAPSGQELFYVEPDGALVGARVDTRGGTWSAGTPAKILEGPYLTGDKNSGRTYDVSTDGKRFLLVKQPANQTAGPQIVVVQNWFDELKRLVPERR